MLSYEGKAKEAEGRVASLLPVSPEPEWEDEFGSQGWAKARIFHSGLLHGCKDANI